MTRPVLANIFGAAGVLTAALERLGAVSGATVACGAGGTESICVGAAATVTGGCDGRYCAANQVPSASAATTKPAAMGQATRRPTRGACCACSGLTSGAADAPRDATTAAAMRATFTCG